jgi:hypothetical protein
MTSDHVWADQFQQEIEFEAKNFDNVYFISSLSREYVPAIKNARETIGSNDLYLIFNKNGESGSTNDDTYFFSNEFENYAMPDMLNKKSSLLSQFKNASNLNFIGMREKYFSIYDMYNMGIRVSSSIRYYFWDSAKLIRYNICLPPYINFTKISNYKEIDLEALRNNILLHVVCYNAISVSEYKTQNIPIIRKDRDFIFNVDTVPILYTIFNRKVALQKTGESEQYDFKNFKEYRNIIFDIIKNDIDLMLSVFKAKDVVSLADIINNKINTAIEALNA